IKNDIRMAGLDSRAEAQLKKLAARRTMGLGGDIGDDTAPHSGKTAAEKLAEKYDRLAAKQLKSIALFGDMSAVSEMRYRTEMGDLAKLSDARKQNLIDQAKELQSLKDQQAAVKTLLPPLVRLQELRDRSDQIDALGGGLGNIARKQMQAQLGSVATGDAPGM